jgi:hypothetical protein
MGEGNVVRSLGGGVAQPTAHHRLRKHRKKIFGFKVILLI